MRPDQRWFPTNRAARAMWFRNFAARFSEVGSSLGFPQAEIDAVNADNAVLQFAVSSISGLEASMDAARAFERLITGGANVGSHPQFPVFDLPEPPPMVGAGVYERLERLVRRIRVAPDYTAATGALLGIIPTNPSVGRFSEFVPAIKVWPLADGYTFSVRCPRLNFDGFTVSFKSAMSQAWKNAGVFAISPATIHVNPTTPGVPEQIEVRARMIKGNDPVTQFSNIVTVTVNP